MKHIELGKTIRGFPSHILRDGTGESLIITESSNAERPMILIKSTNLPVYLNREQASELVTILSDFVENKGEYFNAWDDPQKEFEMDLQKLIDFGSQLCQGEDSQNHYEKLKEKFIKKWKPE